MGRCRCGFRINPACPCGTVPPQSLCQLIAMQCHAGLLSELFNLIGMPGAARAPGVGSGRKAELDSPARSPRQSRRAQAAVRARGTWVLKKGVVKHSSPASSWRWGQEKHCLAPTCSARAGAVRWWQQSSSSEAGGWFSSRRLVFQQEEFCYSCALLLAPSQRAVGPGCHLLCPRGHQTQLHPARGSSCSLLAALGSAPDARSPLLLNWGLITRALPLNLGLLKRGRAFWKGIR